ncbi:MAG: hypothetical protein SO101_01240 [Lachnospiraceae bacterium]|nr:hypothetical protein [Lachnospiraceae bacterium]
MAKQTKGFCKYCGKEYAKSGMLRHLTACKKRKEKLEVEKRRKPCGFFEVVISGKYRKDYWLIIEVDENATLKELDRFIRDIWVECCQHLSSFGINGIQYDSVSATNFWGPPSKSMDYKLKFLFKVGETLNYEYDFGSTTELTLKVQAYRIGDRKKEKITILSRNNPLEILCDQCGKNAAQWVDPQGYYDENPFWCEECLKKSYKDETGYDAEEDAAEEDTAYEWEWKAYIPETFLPVCNSPRMGVCGYTGSKRYPDQFEPDENIIQE